MSKKDRFEMRLTYDEKALLEAAAGWAGLKMSDWARKLLIGNAAKQVRRRSNNFSIDTTVNKE